MVAASPSRAAARGGVGNGAAGGELDEGEEEEAGRGQRRQALLELSQALDFIRPRPAAWTFAPLLVPR